LDEEEDHK
jgi:hypothetical protein